jgi:hypothetical protein
MNSEKIMTAFLLMAVSLLNACGEVTSKVEVVDEAGKPIEGTEVKFSYVNFKDQEDKILTTNGEGIVVGKGTAELRINLSISKVGYYDTHYRKSEGTALRKDQDHDLEITLRKKGSPTSLYAKKVRSKIPEIGVSCGFDFEIGDWVAPYGGGKQGDLMFIASEITSKSGEAGGKLKISFPKEKEGIYKISPKNGFLRESDMKLPPRSGEGGYEPFLERVELSYHNQNSDRECGYFFRIREKTARDRESDFNYAKLNRDFKFHMGGGKFIRKEWRANSPNEYALVEFTYYFNPTPNDRNLEFDPERNLFKNSPHNEQVKQP